MNKHVDQLTAYNFEAEPKHTAWKKPRRLLYAVNHSLPFSSNGYAMRTHWVASALVQSDIEVIVVSRPGLPWDQAGFVGDGFAMTHHIDGVRYMHLRSPSQVGNTEEGYVTQSAETFGEMLRVFHPCAVMAASDWQNALPVALAAQAAGLPFYYEVRGFWEISRASREPGWGDSVEFRDAEKSESTVAMAAAQVFTLNQHMRKELVRRGVPENRISLVPNGFSGWPEIPAADTGLTRASVGSRARFLVGYVGSFNAYEGLEDLIEAVSRLREAGVDVDLLLVGSGESMGIAQPVSQRSACAASAQYGRLAARLGIAEHLFMPGRFSPQQISSYYALLDVVVIPRRPLPVCEIVSPIKPLEAAAHGKSVLLSDVAPLADLAGLCENFHYFAKGNVDALTEELSSLLAAGDFSPSRCERLAELTWESNVAPMVAVIQAASARDSKKARLVGRSSGSEVPD